MNTPWIVVRSATLPVSLRLDRRVPLALLGLLLATIVAIVVNVAVGEYPVSVPDVVRTVLGQPTADAENVFIVNTLRLPRALVAALVGAALGVSGGIMQGLTRNPLASPELTGVTAGAGLAAVILIVALPAAPLAALPFAALGGALAAAALVYSLAWTRGDSPIRLILVGIGLSAFAGALITFFLTFGDIQDVTRALVWLTGSVYARGWDDLRAILPWLAVLLPAGLLLAPHLDTLHLGEDAARGLGNRVPVYRALLLTTAAGLAAAAVAVAGAIGFVGLIAPHIARRLVGPTHVGLLLTAGATGAFIVVAADLVGRTLLAPTEIPCGIVTAAIGAPFFMTLLYRGRDR